MIKISVSRINNIFTFISIYFILFFLPFLLFSHQLLPQLHFFLFSHSISSSLKKLKTLALTKLHCISTIKVQSKGRKSVSLSPNSIKRNATWEPVKSTHSADRTTRGTSHIYGMHYFAKIFLKFSNRPKQRQLPPVKRSSLTHLWQIDFKIYSDLWVKRFANDFRWILLKSSKIEHIPLLDTFKFWAGEELLVSKKTFNT